MTWEDLEKQATPAAHLNLVMKAVNTDPSDAQKDAGNYAKGHWSHRGLNFSIENPKGSTRKGRDRDGKEWSNLMTATYGYIKGSVGADGDHLDVFLGPKLSSNKVFVIDQFKGSGKFDEHKCVLFANSEDEAKSLYLGCYPSGWKCGPITEMSWDDFKSWAMSKETKKPLSKMKTASDDPWKEAEANALLSGVDQAFNSFMGGGDPFKTVMGVPHPRPQANATPVPAAPPQVQVGHVPSRSQLIPQTQPGSSPSRSVMLNQPPEMPAVVKESCWGDAWDPEPLEKKADMWVGSQAEQDEINEKELKRARQDPDYVQKFKGTRRGTWPEVQYAIRVLESEQNEKQADNKNTCPSCGAEATWPTEGHSPTKKCCHKCAPEKKAHHVGRLADPCTGQEKFAYSWGNTLGNGYKVRNLPPGTMQNPAEVTPADGGPNWFEEQGGIQGLGRKGGEMIGNIGSWADPRVAGIRAGGWAANGLADMWRDRNYYGKGLWTGQWDQNARAPEYHGNPDATADDVRDAYGIKKDSFMGMLTSPLAGGLAAVTNGFQNMGKAWNKTFNPEVGYHYGADGKAFKPQNTVKTASKVTAQGGWFQGANGQPIGDGSFWERSGGLRGILTGTSERVGGSTGGILGGVLGMPAQALSGLISGTRMLGKNLGYLWSGDRNQKWSPHQKGVPAGGWQQGWTRDWNNQWGSGGLSSFARELTRPIVTPFQKTVAAW